MADSFPEIDVLSKLDIAGGGSSQATIGPIHAHNPSEQLLHQIRTRGQGQEARVANMFETQLWGAMVFGGATHPGLSGYHAPLHSYPGRHQAITPGSWVAAHLLVQVHGPAAVVN